MQHCNVEYIVLCANVYVLAIIVISVIITYVFTAFLLVLTNIL